VSDIRTAYDGADALNLRNGALKIETGLGALNDSAPVAYVAGSNSDFGDDFAQDAAGNTYLVGGTLSPDFPTTPGVPDRTFTGSEAFAVKLNPTGSALVYSTFLGAGGGSSVVPDASGAVWLAGAGGPGATITADAFDPTFNGGTVDAYVAKQNPAGSAFDFASFLGGSQSEAGNDIALDAGGNV
jgi:hypothetical protein